MKLKKLDLNAMMEVKFYIYLNSLIFITNVTFSHVKEVEN